jgi:hypothetical protein
MKRFASADGLALDYLSPTRFEIDTSAYGQAGGLTPSSSEAHSNMDQLQAMIGCFVSKYFEACLRDDQRNTGF